ncbi:uncharacterized protein C22orf15 homolog isoform X7 [Trachypithecus francoisi]|uniref:uncharacterized protein C22orf15 homolog isoform X7 n=1 Tax=Trachypithecus francoisi TaxID=54180 RepID=UPI00141B47D8|nr:uncharacterized protein C22orf15 homolog isoform X7 [Trachypithecus francoisi]
MFGASAASPWSRFLNRAVSSSSFSVHQTPETLATVAAGCSVLVNTSCRLVNLTAHLRQKAGLPPDASLHVLPATIALLAEDGNLVSLEQDLKEGAAQTQTMGNSLLKERAIYVLVRTIKGEDMVPIRYESLLENLDDHYPELAEELRRLSGLSSAGHNWRKRMGTRRGRHEQSPTSRPRKAWGPGTLLPTSQVGLRPKGVSHDLCLV